MTEIAGVITALVSLLATLGGGVGFILTKILARLNKVEADLERCRERDQLNTADRGVLLAVIELLWAEVKRTNPESEILVRAERLIDKLKSPRPRAGP